MEVAIVMGAIALLSVLLFPFVAGMNDGEKALKANNEAARIYAAIVGSPATGNYGYLGDVGRYPASLMDLLRDPGLEGWNGPYLSGISVENDAMVDPFGSPFEYYYVSDPGAAIDSLAVISKGPDHASTNTSATPNVAATYAGTPLPSSASYYSSGSNPDNLVFPPFTTSSGFLNYSNVGQLSLTILNLDSSASVAAFVPACPNRFEIKVTSATRLTDTWGTATPGSTPAYNPGGATFDLIQGIYKVQVRLATTPYAVYWDETLAVSSGTYQSRTIQIPGPDSSTTGQYTLSVTNNLASAITIYNGATMIGSASSGGSSGGLLVRGCSPITVRDSATNEVLDAFVMPVGITPYNKIYSTTTYTYTLTNNTGTYRYLFVYLNNLLLGEVSGWGNKKVKEFTGLKSGDQIVIKDQSGNAPLSPITISGSGSNTL
jgi:hypothetical protein